MKTTDIYAVYMTIPESANRGHGAMVIEVFTDKDDAEYLALEIRDEVRNQWSWNDITLSEHQELLINSAVEVITLEEAFEKLNL